jgi:hypothetical protein
VSGTRHRSRHEVELAHAGRAADTSGEVTHLTPKQVAQRLQWGYPKVLRAIRAGMLPALDLTLPGSRRAEYRVPLTALERFEREHTVVPREPEHGSAPAPIEAVRVARARSNAAYHDAA